MRYLQESAKWLTLFASIQILTACATQTLEKYAPQASDKPWQPNEQSPWADESSTEKNKQKGTQLDFSIPHLPKQLPALGPIEADTRYQGKTPLTLEQLIDIAQQNNSETKQAWNRAREAALNVGLTEATMLPVLSADVLTGYQQRRGSSVDWPFDLGSTRTRANIEGVVPSLTISWLLFDFGQRAAVRDGAQFTALGANILFNAAHQEVIRDVTNKYYDYNAARIRVDLAKSSLLNHERVQEAVQERLNHGVATMVDLAFAQQAVAQGKLHLVNSTGTEKNAYLALITALGLPPISQVPIAPMPNIALPTANDPVTQERLQEVLNQRADLAAAYAAVRAAETAERAADAEYMPKIFVEGSVAHSRTRLSIDRLPAIKPRTTTSTIAVGINFPIFDGGLRNHQLEKAKVLKDQAAEQLEHMRDLALQEVAGADILLNTALQSHDASTELVQTASIAYDSALESYRHGIVSITMATDAATQLNSAYEAQLDARYAALAAAANLAFVMGDMVSSQDQWLPNSVTPAPALPNE